MARLKVNATRMVLSKMKDQLAMTRRGHTLLKDKQDELMRNFIRLARENQKVRKEVEEALQKCFASFSMAAAVMTPEMLENALRSSKQRLVVDIEVQNVMSVRIPHFKFKQLGRKEGEEANITPYGYLQTSAELDMALEELNEVMEKLLHLAEIEKSCQLMAKELESTRRRVNALEYRRIPDLEDTVKYITMKLDEADRETITRLLKVKDLIDADKEELSQLEEEALEEENGDQA